MSTATDFQDLIDALETNLQLMGLDDAEFDRSTGILGLVDRITDIEPSTNIDLDITCTLSSSENSIDYGESIVLTATLLASYDDTSANNVDLKTGEITGATIQFKQGNTVIGTGITNNNGVATLTYTPTTTGTLNITANFNGTINFNRATSTGINVLVNETLTLTSDKTILSAADNESATLTATLHAANNSGQTVTFEVRKVSDDSLVETLYGTTNSSGVATVYYLGIGAGDIYIKAECRLLIQTYVIEDCLKVGFKSTDTFHAIASSNSMTVTDGVATGYNKLTDYTVPMSSDFEITIDYQCSRSEGGLVFADLTNTNNSDKNTYQILTQGSTDGINFNGYTNTTRSFHKTISSSSGLNQYNTIKFVKQSGTVSAYFNGTLIGSNSVLNNGITDLCIGMYRWNTSNTQSMKNLKIKPL